MLTPLRRTYSSRIMICSSTNMSNTKMANPMSFSYHHRTPSRSRRPSLWLMTVCACYHSSPPRCLPTLSSGHPQLLGNLSNMIYPHIDETMMSRLLPEDSEYETEARAYHTWHIQDWRRLRRKEHGPVFECGGAPWYDSPDNSRDKMMVLTGMVQADIILSYREQRRIRILLP